MSYCLVISKLIKMKESRIVAINVIEICVCLVFFYMLTMSEY